MGSLGARDYADCLAWLEKRSGKCVVLRDTFGYEEGRQKGREEGIMQVLDNPRKYGLEKQGEQKLADLKTKAGNWYICDMEVMNENMVTAFHRDEIYYCPKDGYLDVGGALFEVGCLDVFRLATEKEIPQPKQEWSEEDEILLKLSLENLTELKDRFGEYYGRVGGCIDWLKSLRPQSQWKPSESEVRILEQVIDGTANPINYHATLHAILEKLKKLREE